LINIHFITATGQQIISKISQKFNFIDFLEIVKKNFGEHSMKNSHFICMGQVLKLNDRTTFELQKLLIKNGSIILETIQTKGNAQNDQDQLMIAELNIFQNFYILLSILIFLICCVQNELLL